MFKNPQTPEEAISKKMIAELTANPHTRLTRKIKGVKYEFGFDSENKLVLIYQDDKLIEKVRCK